MLFKKKFYSNNQYVILRRKTERAPQPEAAKLPVELMG